MNSTVQHQKVIEDSRIILDRQKSSQIRHNSHTEART